MRCVTGIGGSSGKKEIRLGVLLGRGPAERAGILAIPCCRLVTMMTEAIEFPHRSSAAPTAHAEAQRLLGLIERGDRP